MKPVAVQNRNRLHFTSLYSYQPDFLAERMCLTHGEQCPSTLTAIIDSNYPLGLSHHVTVSLHETGGYISLTYHLDTIAGS